MDRRLAAEFLGTLLLVVTGIGTGIMGVNLAAGNMAVALLANAFATGLMLYLLITLFLPVSGAHINPAVTLYFLIRREIGADSAAACVLAQTAGALVAVVLTHAMFGLPLLQVATTPRGAPGLWPSEGVATFGLMLTIAGALRHAPGQLPALAGAWIAAAFWFTGSAAFANPAITLARCFTDTFTGILPAHAPAYVAAELATAALAALVMPRLFPR